MLEWIAAAILIVIGIVHSLLGERALVTPLLANPDWRIRTIPRPAADTLLRFAWHLTTMAWWALAATLVGVPIAYTFAATCLASAALILALLPGHLAWPMFTAAGVLALASVDAIPAWAMWIAVGVAALGALVAAAFHVAWALGSSRGATNVIPQRPESGERTFDPAPVPTLAIAGLLVLFAALVVGEATGAGGAWVGWLVVAAFVVLVVRVIGDGRWVGVSKSVRGTGFASADDRWWTPAAGTLALGAAAALALA